MSEKNFLALAHDLLGAILDASQKPRLLPGLILLYTSIDIMSSLIRPVSQAGTNGQVFKKWLRDYMLPHPYLPANDVDLWAARCGILHTSTVESDLSRAGSARKIQYVFDSHEIAAELQAKTDPTAANNVVVSLTELLLAFAGAVEKFTYEIMNNPKLRAQVYHHCDFLIIQEMVPIRPAATAPPTS